MNESDFYVMDDPEVDEEFLQEIEQRILYIEHMNMWKVPYKSFVDIEKECAQIVRDIKAYEKRADCEFPCFRECETRIRKQESRCDRTKYRVGNDWIPWSER